MAALVDLVAVIERVTGTKPSLGQIASVILRMDLEAMKKAAQKSLGGQIPGGMPPSEVVRSDVQRCLQAVPFRPFVLNMENGNRVVIKHPENIAFSSPSPESGAGGSEDFYVISNRLRLFSTFNAVRSVVLIDKEELAG